MPKEPINDGGPAFPQVIVRPDMTIFMQQGMTLRDWFAGMTMAGLSAMPDHDVTVEEEAEIAYRQADAMIAQRTQQ